MASDFAFAAQDAPFSISLATTAALTAAALATIACFVQAVADRKALNSLRNQVGEHRARTCALLSFRDAILDVAGEAVVVSGRGSDSRLEYGRAASLVAACMSGPDAKSLSAARTALEERGTCFSLTARTSDDRAISVRGRPIGGRAVIFLKEREAAARQPELNGDPELDFLGALDAVPIPVWIRGRDLALRWVNRAFLAANKFGTKEEAVRWGMALERSERELAGTARDIGQPVKAKRYAAVGGTRRAYSFSLHPLPDGSVAGAALDLAAVSPGDPAQERQSIDAYAATLNWLSTAVAIFGLDQRLVFYNRAYAGLWGLSERWLDTHPAKGEIFDRLREMRRLPEQHDFPAWKREHLKAFGEPGHLADEYWHLPDGKSVHVVRKPHPCGGLIVLFEDVTERLRMESSYKAQIKVQKATLESLHEGVAVFGPDARLKLYNTEFARLWRLDDQELAGEPHLKAVADACTAKFGDRSVWDFISSAINSIPAEQANFAHDLERSDGRVLALSIARLPDSGTLVNFADVTGQIRLEDALCERPSLAARLSK